MVCHKFGHPARNCPDRHKPRGQTGANETNLFALIELEELVFLLDDPGGIWAILDCGATKSLIGVTMAEYLTYDMKEKHDLDFDLVKTTRAFTFGDGQRKSSMGSTIGNIFLGGGEETIEISVMDNEVPLLIGMDILGPECTSAMIDCGNGYLLPPKLSSNIFQCRKIPSGHLAINVTSPAWWQGAHMSLQNVSENASCNALEDEAGPSGAAGAPETVGPTGSTARAAVAALS